MGIVKRNIDQLDKLLHQPWADKYCQTFEDKTKIKRTWVALALIGFASCGLLVGFAAQIICNFIGFLYPAYGLLGNYDWVFLLSEKKCVSNIDQSRVLTLI